MRSCFVSAMSWLALLSFLAVMAGGHEAHPQVVSRCGKRGSPDIRFPFWLKNHSSTQEQPCCDLRNHFGLSCTSHSDTVLDLASSVNLSVKSIDYESRLIRLYDPRGCLPRRLLRLNLSTSPFQYHGHQSSNYDLAVFNCSPSTVRPTTSSMSAIPCLGRGHKNQVYAVPLDESVSSYDLLYCEKIGTIPGQVNYFPPNSLLVHRDITLEWIELHCSDSKGEAEKRKVAGVVVGSFLLVVAAAGLCHLYTTDKAKKESSARIVKFLEDYRALKPTRYSYADIKRVTHNFKQRLGQGGFGTVFKGKLSSEIHVAVKILNSTGGDGEEFLNEVGTMGRIHHINVVRLVGFCADGFRKALVYEFLPKGTLQEFIYSESIRKALGWKKLKDTALGIAKGIEYLHQGCDQQILHFDIKPTNVLLDDNFNPKISDFGLAKLCAREQSAVSVTAARGTIGYISPEVFSRNFGSASHKSDVYSFGMLLLDMIEGRGRDDIQKENSSQGYFPDWIYSQLERGEVIGTGVDTIQDANIAKHLTIVGLWCIQWYPTGRPSMKAVVQMIEGEGDDLTMPPNPFSCANPTAGSTNARGRDFNMELEAIFESEQDD